MRKSISTAFFSMVSTLMVLGIVLMGCSEWVLFKNYFAKDRYETLDQVVNVAKRTAEYLVNSETMPQGAELDALNTKLEIIGESAEAYLFFTDRQGNVLIASDPDKLTTTTVPLDICQRANAVADPDARHYHAFGDLGGALTEKSYIAAVETIDDQSLFSGWLFLCSSVPQVPPLQGGRLQRFPGGQVHHRHLKGYPLLRPVPQVLGISTALETAFEVQGAPHLHPAALVGQTAPGDAGEIIRPAIAPVHRQDHVTDRPAQGGGPEAGRLAQCPGQEQAVLVLPLLQKQLLGKHADDQPAAHAGTVVEGADLPMDRDLLPPLQPAAALQQRP